MTKTQLVYDSANDGSIDGDRLADDSVSNDKLESGIDSAKANYTPSWAGAQARTVQDRLEDFVNVADFGAKPDGSDATEAIQAAIDSLGNRPQLDWARGIFFEPGTYRISSSLNFNLENITVTSSGIARIQPFTPASSDFPLFNIPTGTRVKISNISMYMFGSQCTGIKANILYRQALIHNCVFVGGEIGIDLSSDVANKWGVTVDKCRFDSGGMGIKWRIGGQTGAIRDCLFFNNAVGDLDLSSGSQMNVVGCVFEQAGAAKSPSITVENIRGLTFINCQAERLGWDSSRVSGVKSDYQFQFTNTLFSMIGCRFWGGSFGSVSPGSSRAFGLYLDNSKLTLIDSVIFSFRWMAMKMVNGSTCTTDTQSNLDFRCLGGEPNFLSLVDLGENQIIEGDFRRWIENGTSKLPLSWVPQIAGVGSIRKTTDLLEPSSQAAIDYSSATGGFITNLFSVSKGEWVTVRFSIKSVSFTNFNFVDQDGAIFSRYDGGGSRVTSAATKDPEDSSKDGSALIVHSILIPDGVTSMGILFPSGVIVESLAAYRGIKVQEGAAGSLFSDNDANYGCFVNLAPPLPYKPSKEMKMQNVSPSLIRGSYLAGDRLVYSNPTPGGFEGVVCTTGGESGSGAVFKTFGSISS